MAGPATTFTGLVEHDTALSSLLESLLVDVPCAGDEMPQQSAAPAQTVPSTAPQSDGLNTARPQPLPQEYRKAESRPAWAAHDFRALLFRIGEYRFAMPLVLMHSVTVVPEQRTRLPAQAPWHLGLMYYRGRPVVLADLGPLIGVQARCGLSQYVLVIGEGDGGVLCDQVEEAVLVCPDEVRWRRGADERTWLAGFLTQQMCVLLDADALGESIGHV